jgi:predicted O-linked N-acetylglucosamine transferase (SPINDLY family)
MDVDQLPEPNSLPALGNRFVTFGCLNNFCKVNSQVLALWAKVLLATANSRLMMLAPPGQTAQRVADMMKSHGVSGDRLIFMPRQPRPLYMKMYDLFDIGLDSFPYNGHTTSLDSYWMGVPVVTLAGPTVVGRAGVSQLTNLGMTELIARTPQQYVEIAAGLAGDLGRLSEIRRGLRNRMTHSPLMDGPRFARNMEAAYRQMWRAWCENGAKR